MPEISAIHLCPLKGKTESFILFCCSRLASLASLSPSRQPPPSPLSPTTNNNNKGRLPLSTKLAYGAPALATTSLTFLVSVYLTDFYVALGAPLAFLNFFTAAARSLDVLTDPVMGWASDRTRGKFGRRLPYTLSGCLVYGALFAALFSPPAAVLSSAEAGHVAPGSPAAGRAVAWFAVTYTAFYLADTWCNVPYEALGPELSDDYNERSRVFFIVKLFNQFGKKKSFFLSSFFFLFFFFFVPTRKNSPPFLFHVPAHPSPLFSLPLPLSLSLYL